MTYEEVHSKIDFSNILSAKVEITVEKKEKRTIHYLQRSWFTYKISEGVRQRSEVKDGKLKRTLTGENHITLRIQIVKEKFTTRMISRRRTNR